MSEGDTRDWALAYAAFGWRVFPVVPGGKRPMYAGWQRDATTDRDLIARYWRSDPGPNVGLICGEAFDAFDIEVDHLQTFREWLRVRDRRLPDTPIARTGRGGIHILVQPFSVAGRVLRLDGVHIGELKAVGGFIVACPSRTSAVYNWLRSPHEAAVAEAPDWLRALAVGATPRPAAVASTGPISPSGAVALVAGLYRVVATASEGERNRILFWASCRIAEHGLDQAAAAEILLEAARQAGLPEREARATIVSGLRA